MGAILDRLARFVTLRNAIVWARQDMPTTRFLGRNGTGKSCGIIALANGRDDRGRDVVALAPITSRGEIGKCQIDVPLVDLVDLVDRLTIDRGDADALARTVARRAREATAST